MNVIRGVLLAGGFRTHHQLIAMSADDQRNALIVEMANHSNQTNYQSFSNDDLAGVGALMVFLLKAGICTPAQLRTISADDQRNIMIVEIDGSTQLGGTLQGLSNLDLVLLGLGKNLPGSLDPSSFIRGVLLAGGIRTHHELVAMSADDQRNTLIVEMAGHSNQPIAHFQSLNNFELAGAGAAMVFLREGGIRDATQLKTISDDDQRNIAIVEVDGQTHLGARLQELRTFDVVATALGVDPIFFVPKPPLTPDKPDKPEKPRNPEKPDNPELGDPTGAGDDTPKDPPKEPPPEVPPPKEPPPEGGCFIGDTPVLMADGVTKRIDAVAIGDRVMARDEKTGLVAVGAIDRVFRHHVAETLLLKTDEGEVVETTAEHRFASEKRGFVSAGQLRPGDRLLTHNDRAVAVVSTGTRSAEVTVYNLSVDRFQTFFIGGARLWVHNLKDSEPPPEEPPPKEP
jgi:Pretoxin HINT domain